VPLGWRRSAPPIDYDIAKEDWRMPRGALLTTLRLTTSRRWLLRLVAGYLSVAGVLLVVRIVQLWSA
jgi:hypothetical protein